MKSARKAAAVVALGFASIAAGAATHTLPLVLPASSQALQGFVRILNQSDRAGTVSIHAIDDTGREFGPVSLSIGARSARHFTSTDLERGNAGKGLSAGVGDGSGNWRLKLDTTLDIEPLAYIRTADGFVTSMHDVVAPDDSGTYLVPIFNPGKNRSQVSMLRIINPQGAAAEVVIDGTDDRGDSPASKVRLSIPAGGARTLTVQELEVGASGLTGRFGTGSGKWQLSVTADRPIHVVNLLRSPSGHLANLSTTTAEGDIEICTDETRCERGRYAVPGINDIPFRSLRAANVDIQKMFVVSEVADARHGRVIRRAACGSYAIQCDDPESGPSRTRNADRTVTVRTTGTTPYMAFTDLGPNVGSGLGWQLGLARSMKTLKIYSRSQSMNLGAGVGRQLFDVSREYLIINSLGNSGGRISDVNDRVRKAISEDSLLFAAGWHRSDGSYIPHSGSTRCGVLDDGCLWLQYNYGYAQGTSLSSPNLGAALASVLSVFPDTTYQNLARLAKACARRAGDGIERLLQEWGGVGVADFTCMKEIIDARDGLLEGGTVDVTINGYSVTVGQWSLEL